jgi:hypothetical protein
MQLRFASLVVINSRWDFHPQECAHAGRTTKSRQVWRLFGLSAAIFQIERDPPAASELSKLKYQK